MTAAKPQHGGPRVSADPNAHRGPATVEEPWVAVTVRLTPAEAAWLDSRGGKRKRGATMRGLLQVEMGRSWGTKVS